MTRPCGKCLLEVCRCLLVLASLGIGITECGINVPVLRRGERARLGEGAPEIHDGETRLARRLMGVTER